MTLTRKKIISLTFIFHLLLAQKYRINNYQSEKQEMQMKTPNYTQAQVAQITEAYNSGQAIDEIADAVGKSVRSVRSKLVREGVYVAKPKTSSKKVLGPTKKELLRKLDGHMDTKGLEGATKEAIERLIGIMAN
tara:strand:+ start:327 stop:728 length:402 start_codon:yes stop_codon:yes gene_type:complete